MDFSYNFSWFTNTFHAYLFPYFSMQKIFQSTQKKKGFNFFISIPWNNFGKTKHDSFSRDSHVRLNAKYAENWQKIPEKIVLKTKSTQINEKQRFFRWRFAKRYSIEFIQYHYFDKTMNFEFDLTFSSFLFAKILNVICWWWPLGRISKLYVWDWLAVTELQL